MLLEHFETLESEVITPTWLMIFQNILEVLLEQIF